MKGAFASQGASLVLPLLAVLAGCAGPQGSGLPTERFSNTVWREVCAGDARETAYLRFLPDGTFAWSTTGLAPGDFRHDGDDRWGVVERTLVVAWDGDAAQTQYRESEGDPDVFVGAGNRPCGGEARLERVE